MRTKYRSTKGDSDEETIESMPRSVPKQVGQSTIKHNYENLTSIPTTLQPHLIRHLYLSHNKIASLAGIEEYTALESLNISYNCISETQELRRIANPHFVKHIKMRMNPLPYGYEDYAVSIFKELVTFEDAKITKESKELHFIMRGFVSTHFIDFY
jgi:hypothetical protein